MDRNIGIMIDQGSADWQVYQQGPNGTADIAVSGRWGPYEGKKAVGVYVRIVTEGTNVPVASHLDWHPGRLRRDGTWSAVLPKVPAGGLYRLETALHLDDEDRTEWAGRGDTRHFLGVGDLWIIAGQSNSAGFGKGPWIDPPQLGVHIFNNAMRWALASQPLNESTDTAHPENREYANSGHSPWLWWAKLVQAQVHHPIGLIQVSLGGSPLCVWDPNEKEHPLFDIMVRSVRSAGGKVRGVLWYQGCSDTSPSAAKTYLRRFARAVRGWRKAMDNRKLAVLTVQINRVGMPADKDSQRGWTMLRETQRQAAKTIPDVTVSPTLDLTLSDVIHTTPEGNAVLAQRVAMAALATVYGRDVDYKAPEPTAAALVASGKVIAIEFENVRDRIACDVNEMANPFVVEDTQGIVPVERVEYPSPLQTVVQHGPWRASRDSRTVRLHLARKPQGRTMVHGGYGTYPSTVPFDVVRMMPMLGFYGLVVE